jgi:cytochrome P450
MLSAMDQEIPFLADLQHISSFAEVREVLQSPLFDAVAHTADAAFILAGTLVAVDGEEHRARRRMELALFTPTALERYERAVLGPAIDRHLDLCAIDDDGSMRTDLVQMARLLSMEIGAQIIGVDVSSHARLRRFASLAEEITQGARVQWMTVDATEIIASAQAAKAAFVAEFFDPAVKERQQVLRQLEAGDVPPDEVPLDVLTLILMHREELERWPSWDEDLPVREALLFVIASAFTIAMSISHAVAHITDWQQDHPDTEVTTAFLRRATNESLRLHHSSPANLRRANADVVLTSGRTVARGELIAILEGAAGLDPSVYGPHAGEFQPYRNSASRAYAMAFGAGQHVCLGQALATGVRDGERTTGALFAILQRLFELRLRRDPLRPPVRDGRTFADFYSSFPIILDRPEQPTAWTVDQNATV